MDIRDAVEEDAEALARIADAPTDVLRNVIHDRTVRVASSGDADEILAFVAFDASPETVHVTQLSGHVDACRQLLREPVRFADHEGMAVEILIPDAESQLRAIADEAGFVRDGAGPRFDGQRTTRYRREFA